MNDRSTDGPEHDTLNLLKSAARVGAPAILEDEQGAQCHGNVLALTDRLELSLDELPRWQATDKVTLCLTMGDESFVGRCLLTDVRHTPENVHCLLEPPDELLLRSNRAFVRVVLEGTRVCLTSPEHSAVFDVHDIGAGGFGLLLDSDDDCTPWTTAKDIRAELILPDARRASASATVRGVRWISVGDEKRRLMGIEANFPPAQRAKLRRETQFLHRRTETGFTILVATGDRTRDKLSAALDATGTVCVYRNAHTVEDLQYLSNQHSWNMVIAGDGIEGLDPSMVLRRFENSRPETLRVALVGAKPNGALGCIHQSWSETRSSSAIVEHVKQLSLLDKLVGGAGARTTNERFRVLPPPPPIVVKVHEAWRQKKSAPDLTRILNKDPREYAEFTAFVSSTSLLLRPESGNAVPMEQELGCEKSAALITLHAMSKVLGLQDTVSDRTHAKGIATAILSEQLMRDTPSREASFAAGLLSGVGSLLLRKRMPDVSQYCDEQAARADQSLWLTEMDELGTHHGRIGAFWTCAWGVPTDVTEAIERQYFARSVPKVPKVEDAVYVARTIVDGDEDSLDAKWWRLFGKDADTLRSSVASVL